MRINLIHLVLVLFLMLAIGSPALAQDDQQAGDADGSSEQVESRDEAYRRQMELEDARRQDPGFVDPVDTYKKDPEKIDKLPEESRDNIRDQLIDVIVENGEWEPSDALEDYPYQPTEAAKNDPVLKEQEQEAWDEQIDKYHEREASAFGSHRGPVPGPGNPTGQEGGSQGNSGSQQGQGQQGGQQGQGSSGGGDGQESSGSAGTYQPGANGSSDAASTAGVSESALDFLKGRQGQQAQSQAGQSAPAGSQAQSQAGQSPPAGSQPQSQSGQSAQAGSQAQSQAEQSAQAGTQEPPQGAESQAGEEQAQTAGAEQSAAEWAQQAQNQQSAEQSPEQQAAEAPPEQQQSEQAQSEQQSEQAQDATPEVELETRGIIAIKDLDKLEGADQAEQPGDQEEQ